ncbi:MAG: flagellar biosynthetic protein FliQ [Alphaproteobacteria bacterium]|nr:flagellar biosynthetic protein FliQ [Alphaproteobacteria bacterium]NCQ87605.1 flagellar biosynthetic protein FliQ [Alphaproteobacteria bacterium]NCT05886.1 flagellar biosynthetic protein FliQ [Alphaproteobacteria bacterium]
MNQNEIIDIARDAIMLVITLGTPVMMVGLLVGVSIALLQALTQVQEITLVFVPKILAIFFAIFLMLPAFATAMIDFMNVIADKIVGIG